MNKKRPYKRKTTKPTKRKRTTRAAVKRRRKPAENKILDVAAKIIRLAVLIAICGFIIYRLFQPGAKKDQSSYQQAIDTIAVKESTVEPSPEQEVKLDTLSKDQALDYLLNRIFQSFNLEDSWIKRTGKILRVDLPRDVPPITIIWEIIQEIKQLDLKVIKSEENLKRNRSTILIGTEKDALLTIIFRKNYSLQRKTGKIAIIIDDFGYYNNKTTDQFIKFNYPLTLSIIPGQKYSLRIAQQAKEHQKPIMIHLPMEALEEKVEDGEFTIMTDLPDSVVAHRVRKALSSLPGAVGMNNHMGSKATADTQIMNIVFRQLKSTRTFFVDSRTTNKSVVSIVAPKYAVKYALNDGFLESKKNEDKHYIRNKLAAIAKIARRRGRAIVIGHPYRETIKVLSQEIPNLEKKGFKIVPVAELVR